MLSLKSLLILMLWWWGAFWSQHETLF